MGERTEDDGLRDDELEGDGARWRERPRRVLDSCSSSVRADLAAVDRLWLRSRVRPLLMSGLGEGEALVSLSTLGSTLGCILVESPSLNNRPCKSRQLMSSTTFRRASMTEQGSRYSRYSTR